jgi:hypothetical protein
VAWIAASPRAQQSCGACVQELMQAAMDARFMEQEAQLLVKLAELQTRVAK